MMMLATTLSGLSLLMSLLLLIKLAFPLGWFTLFPRLTAGALSPFRAVLLCDI